ncbi:MAG TPA: aldehyde dehydrogenase family protein, partial [Candidatus Xenobia bacterium]
RNEVSKIVEEVLKQYLNKSALDGVKPQRGIFATMDDAVAAAKDAQRKLMALSLEKRYEIIAAMRATGLQHARHLAEMAVAETGLGRVEDKINKITLQCKKTPGPEDLEPRSWTGDKGFTLEERAPFGVLGSVTPVTNPAATIINNSISMISAGNSVVFNPHPSAKRVCQRSIELLNEAIEQTGGPPNVITTIEEPSLESSGVLMKHPGIRVLVVTGGPYVVKAAMASGKRAIAAGPGNPPVLVDETADIRRAARDTLAGHAFDNNVMCTCEKEVFVVDRVFSDFIQEIRAVGAHELTPLQLDQVVKTVVKPGAPGERSSMVKDFVGKDPSIIARAAGFEVPAGTRTLLAVDVPQDHPLVQLEQLMPVLPVVRCRTWEEGMQWAIQAEHGYCHTAIMHSRNVEAMSVMAKAVCVSLFVKNGPNYASLGFGGEGPTTMTIAGTTGEGVTSARIFTRPRRCTMVELFRIV